MLILPRWLSAGAGSCHRSNCLSPAGGVLSQRCQQAERARAEGSTGSQRRSTGQASAPGGEKSSDRTGLGYCRIFSRVSWLRGGERRIRFKSHLGRQDSSAPNLITKAEGGSASVERWSSPVPQCRCRWRMGTGIQKHALDDLEWNPKSVAIRKPNGEQ